MAQFTNQATMTYNGITVNSNTVTGEITQVITAWKRASADDYRAGDTITYVVNIQNAGPINYTGLTITDDLGEYAFGTGTVVPQTFTGDEVIYSVNGQLQPEPTVTAGPPLVISGINVPAGQSAEVVYRVRVNEFAQQGTGAGITNTAVIGGGGITEPVTVTDTVAADTSPELSIFKELRPATVVENGQITYVLTIQNTGAEAITATDSLVISDVFNPILDAPLTVTLDGVAWPQTGNYTYNTATGEFATTPGVVTVPGAAYTQNPDTGVWTVTPGVTTLTITSTI